MKKGWILAGCSTLLLASMMTQAQEAPQQSLSSQDTGQPITQEEIRQGLAAMQQRLNSRIEQWGKTLSRDDFEWTWRGRQMKPAKRQEVCDIFQGVVNEMYQIAVKNKARLSPEDQKLLSNRDLFIEKLGFQNNRVNTQMGFDCRLQ